MSCPLVNIHGGWINPNLVTRLAKVGRTIILGNDKINVGLTVEEVKNLLWPAAIPQTANQAGDPYTYP
jgi:hypothetical protein